MRLDGKGRVVDTQYRLVARESAYAARERRGAPTVSHPPSSQGFGYSYGWGWSNNGWHPDQEQRRSYDGYQRAPYSGNSWNRW